ncbi:MAG: hypothetical protein K2O41_02420 [Clostridia bacterium]|nr:hypothetical protein [Clostridia bacterium]
MSMMHNQDWRIETYRGHLNGETFSLKDFVSTATNNHEHCVFCWRKITDLNIEECDREGYCAFNSKTGQANWVCKGCFNDFKEQFNFKLK